MQIGKITQKKRPAPEKRKEAAHLGEDIKTAFAALKRLYDNQQILKESGINQQELSFTHTDFRALCLNEIEWIRNPDLSSANLTGAYLVWAQLDGADLEGAQLNGANLEFAQLNDANLKQAQLNDAYLKYAQLNSANLMYAELHGAILMYAELHGAILIGAQLHSTNLMYAQLHGADLKYAELHGTNLMYAELHGADLRDAELHGADLGYAKSHGANLMYAQLHGANLMYAQLHSADLRDAELHGANLMYTQLHGANLKRVQTQYTSFEAVRFEGLADDDLEKLKSDLGELSLSEQKRSYIVNRAGQDAQVEVENWKVWHTSEFLDKRQIDRLDQDDKWDLEWLAKIKRGNAQVATLKGLLRNFGGER